MEEENVFTLIGRSLNGQSLAPYQVNRIIEHYTQTIERIRAVQLTIAGLVA